MSSLGRCGICGDPATLFGMDAICDPCGQESTRIHPDHPFGTHYMAAHFEHWMRTTLASDEWDDARETVYSFIADNPEYGYGDESWRVVLDYARGVAAS